MTINADDIREIAGVPDPQAVAADEPESTEEEAVEEQEPEALPEEGETEETAPEETEEIVEEEVDSRHLINFRRNEEDQEYELVYGEDGKLHEDTVANIRTMLEKEGLEVKAQHAVEARKEIEKQLQAEKVKAETTAADLARAEVGSKQWGEFTKDPQTLALINRSRQQQRLPAIDPAKMQLEAELAVKEQELQRVQFEDTRRQVSDFVYSLAEEFMRKNPEIDEDTCGAIGAYVGGELGIVVDHTKPLPEQRERMMKALEGGRQAFIGRGKILSPEVMKANKETAEAKRKLEASRKRQAVRNPSAGGGAVGSKGQPKKKKSMRGMSRAEVAELYRVQNDAQG